jgi:hypothetical protein
MTGVAWCYEDPSAAAKVVKAFRKDHDKLKIKAGPHRRPGHPGRERCREPARDHAGQERAPERCSSRRSRRRSSSSCSSSRHRPELRLLAQGQGGPGERRRAGHSRGLIRPRSRPGLVGAPTGPGPARRAKFAPADAGSRKGVAPYEFCSTHARSGRPGDVFQVFEGVFPMADITQEQVVDIFPICRSSRSPVSSRPSRTSGA